MSDYKYTGYLEARLQLWAWWYHRWETGEIGWPSNSIMSIIKEFGTMISSSKPKEIPTNDLADEVNFWVVQMGKQYPQLEQALRDYYFHSNLPLKKLASKNNISVSNFKERVKDAKIWLSGRISAELESK